MEINGQQLEATGTVVFIEQPRSGTSASGRQWCSQGFTIEVIDPSAQYPRHINFSVFGQDRLNQMLPLLTMNNLVKIHFDIDARESNGRWFNSINVWRVEPGVMPVMGGVQPAMNYGQPQMQYGQPQMQYAQPQMPPIGQPQPQMPYPTGSQPQAYSGQKPAQPAPSNPGADLLPF